MVFFHTDVKSSLAFKSGCIDIRSPLDQDLDTLPVPPSGGEMQSGFTFSIGGINTRFIDFGSDNFQAIAISPLSGYMQRCFAFNGDAGRISPSNKQDFQAAEVPRFSSDVQRRFLAEAGLGIYSYTGLDQGPKTVMVAFFGAKVQRIGTERRVSVDIHASLEQDFKALKAPRSGGNVQRLIAIFCGGIQIRSMFNQGL